VTRTASLPRALPAAGSHAEPAAPGWLLWTNLWIIYVVWGSTYFAIRVMVETVPPLLGAGLRFLIAGVLMLGFLTLRRGWRTVRPGRRALLGTLLVGLLLPGANAVVTVAEVDVPSALAALLIASLPLIVIVLRKATGEQITRLSLVGVVVGFVGVALLLMPGERPDGAPLWGMLLLIGAAVMWATGSFISPKIELPRDPFVTTGWQMLLGGSVITLAGLAAGEAGDVHLERFSLESSLAWAYLVLIGSIVAYSSYVWLLQNAPVSKVSTYAYVNPVIAIALGWLFLDETITAMTLAGAAIIVTSVAVVVRVEATRGRAARRASTARSASESG
jgi:drug/metabolite transporter (DMT)-like permease